MKTPEEILSEIELQIRAKTVMITERYLYEEPEGRRLTEDEKEILFNYDTNRYSDYLFTDTKRHKNFYKRRKL